MYLFYSVRWLLSPLDDEACWRSLLGLREICLLLKKEIEELNRRIVVLITHSFDEVNWRLNSIDDDDDHHHVLILSNVYHVDLRTIKQINHSLNRNKKQTAYLVVSTIEIVIVNLYYVDVGIPDYAIDFYNQTRKWFFTFSFSFLSKTNISKRSKTINRKQIWDFNRWFPLIWISDNIPSSFFFKFPSH